jgi:hypothetical protein
MGHGTELRVPFLDLSLVKLAMRLPCAFKQRERCGHDLDRAIADGAARPDYTLAERARDLAGAARWNAVLAVRERRAQLRG